MTFLAKIFAPKRQPQVAQPQPQARPAAPAPAQETTMDQAPERKVRRRGGTRTAFGGLSAQDQAETAKKTLLGE